MEVIVVDDGSTDETEGRVRELRDSRVRLLQRPTPGPGGYAARNAAIEAAAGEWVAFLDADDDWLPHHLQTLAELHKRFVGSVLLSASWRVVGAPGQERGNHYFQRYQREGPHKLDLETFLARWAGGAAPVWTSAACAGRDALLSVGGFPADRCTRGGDVDTWLRIMLRDGTMAYSPEITAVYHRDVEDSVTRRRTPQINHCTSLTVAEALSREHSRKTRSLLKRVANTHKKDPIRKKARREGLALRDLQGFYPTANPGFYLLAFGLAICPPSLVRALLTLRDRAVSMRGKP